MRRLVLAAVRALVGVVALFVGSAAGPFVYSWPTFQSCVLTLRGAVGISPGPRWMEKTCHPDLGTFITATGVGAAAALLVIAFAIGLRAYVSSQ
jgi:hypothetical protein